MEMTIQVLWQCGYCKNKNFESSRYCSSCFIGIEYQPLILLNEYNKKRMLVYWINNNERDEDIIPLTVYELICKYFEDKDGILELWRPQRLKFGSFYSAGAFYKKYCNGKKWHKSLGECDVDKYKNVNVYDCTSNKLNLKISNDGHILFHFGFLKDSNKNGDYSFDYETKAVYYYVNDDTILEM